MNIPLQACEHFYIVTEPLDGMEPGMPTVRDPGGYTYFKEETGKIMAGFFEPRGKVWKLDGIPPRLFVRHAARGLGPRGAYLREKAVHRVPTLGECGLQLFFNGPEAFTTRRGVLPRRGPRRGRLFRRRRIQLGRSAVGRRRRLGAGGLDS